MDNFNLSEVVVEDIPFQHGDSNYAALKKLVGKMQKDQSFSSSNKVHEKSSYCNL